MKIQQSGMSLLSVLIFMAVIGISLPIIFGILTNSNKRTAKRIHQQDYIFFIQSMREKLQDPKICRDLLANQSVNRTIGAETNLSLNLGYGNSPGPIKADWTPSNSSFVLSRVYIEATGIPFNLVRPWGSSVAVETIPFRIYFQPNEYLANLENSTTAPIPPETVPPGVVPDLQLTILANIDSSNRIVSCHGPTSQASVCESIGGVYDSSEPNPELKCKPDKVCFSSKLGMVNSQSACPAPYNSHIQALGKIGSSERYLCSWCHNP